MENNNQEELNLGAITWGFIWRFFAWTMLIGMGVDFLGNFFIESFTNRLEILKASYIISLISDVISLLWGYKITVKRVRKRFYIDEEQLINVNTRITKILIVFVILTMIFSLYYMSKTKNSATEILTRTSDSQTDEFLKEFVNTGYTFYIVSTIANGIVYSILIYWTNKETASQVSLKTIIIITVLLVIIESIYFWGYNENKNNSLPEKTKSKVTITDDLSNVKLLEDDENELIGGLQLNVDALEDKDTENLDSLEIDNTEASDSLGFEDTYSNKEILVEISKNSTSELAKNITVNGTMTKLGELLLTAENDNEVAVDMEIKSRFYDEDGNIVYSNTDNLQAVEADTEIAIEISSMPEDFNRCKIFVVVKQTRYYSFVNKLKLSHNNNGEEIVVQVKNDSKNIIEELNVSVLYYKDDKIIGIDSETEWDLEPSKTANFDYNYYDNDIKFDTYKIFVNKAFSTVLYSKSEMSKNITSSGVVTDSGALVVIAKNDNEVAADIEIEVEFYDDEGTIIGHDTRNLHAVGANREIAIEMRNIPESFDNYKILIEAEQTRGYSYFGKLELNHHNKNEYRIDVQVKNNSQDIIEDINVSVIYYKGDEIVGIDSETEFDTKPGKIANFRLYPYDKNYNYVKFDSYKVFINEAYSFDR